MLCRNADACVHSSPFASLFSCHFPICCPCQAAYVLVLLLNSAPIYLVSLLELPFARFPRLLRTFHRRSQVLLQSTPSCVKLGKIFSALSRELLWCAESCAPFASANVGQDSIPNFTGLPRACFLPARKVKKWQEVNQNAFPIQCLLSISSQYWLLPPKARRFLPLSSATTCELQSCELLRTPSAGGVAMNSC